MTAPTDRARILAAGFQAHVPKPVDPVELTAAIATIRWLAILYTSTWERFMYAALADAAATLEDGGRKSHAACPPRPRSRERGIPRVRLGKPIGICGQAPSDYPEFAAWLVEQGIGSISLNPDVAIATAVRVAEAQAKAAVGGTKR